MQNSTQMEGAIAKVTERELEVMQMVWEDHTNREISDSLFISVRTVEWHIQNVKDKLSTDDRLIIKKREAAKILYKAGSVK